MEIILLLTLDAVTYTTRVRERAGLRQENNRGMWARARVCVCMSNTRARGCVLRAVGRAVNIIRKSASEAERDFAVFAARGAAARHGTAARHGGAAWRRAVRVARQGNEKYVTH
jgi:hypothetical protein